MFVTKQLDFLNVSMCIVNYFSQYVCVKHPVDVVTNQKNNQALKKHSNTEKRYVFGKLTGS